MKGSMRSRGRPLPVVFAAAITAVVLTLLLWPHHVDGLINWLAAHAPFSGPQASTDRRGLWWALEDAGNVTLFLPVGFAIAWWRRSVLAGALFGAVLSILCETAQFWIPTRHPSLLDVLCNVIGAAIGAGCAALLPRVGFRARNRSLSDNIAR